MVEISVLEPDRNYDCIPDFHFTPEQVDAIEFCLKKWNCIVGLKPGLGKCKEGWSRIQTERGYVRLDSLVENPKEGFQPIDIKVSTRFGEKRAVSFYFERDCRVRRLVTEGGYLISGTLKHRVLSFDGNGEVDMVPISDLKVGDYLLISEDFSDWETSAENELTDIQNYDVGLWLGSPVEDNVINRLYPPAYPEEARYVADEIFKGSIRQKLFFLIGLLDSPIATFFNHQLVWWFASKELADGVCAVMESCGIVYHRGVDGEFFTVKVKGDSMRKFLAVEVPWSKKQRDVGFWFGESEDLVGFSEYVTLPDAWVEKHLFAMECESLCHGTSYEKNPYLNIVRHLKDGRRRFSKWQLKKCEPLTDRFTPFLKYNFQQITYSMEVEADVYDIEVEDVHEYMSQGLANHNTATLLRVAYQILTKSKKTACFIICPKEANTAFKKELERRFRLPYSILTTDEKNVDKRSRIFLFNYSNVTPMINTLNLMKEHGIKVFLIADEVHIMGSADSKISKTLRELRPQFSCVFGATGTPILNAVEGLWRIVDFVSPGYLGKYNDFRYRYISYRLRNVHIGHGKTRTFQEVVGFKNLDELRERLRDVVITRGIDYDIDYIYRRCDLTEEEKASYEIAARGVFESDDEKHIPARLHDLQRIADGSHHLMDGDKLYSKAKLLIKVLREIVDRGEGALIYTEYEDTYRTLGDVVKAARRMIGYRNLYFITGKTQYKKRVECEQRLGDRDIVILTKAGNRSINLQAVNNIVVYDIPFSVGDFVQLIGRVTRVDTKHEKQHVYILEAEQTIDTYKRLLIESHLNVVQQIFGKDENMPYYGDVDKDIMSKYRSYFKRKFLWCKA